MQPPKSVCLNFGQLISSPAPNCGDQTPKNAPTPVITMFVAKPILPLIYAQSKPARNFFCIAHTPNIIWRCYTNNTNLCGCKKSGASTPGNIGSSQTCVGVHLIKHKRIILRAQTKFCRNVGVKLCIICVALFIDLCNYLCGPNFL